MFNYFNFKRFDDKILITNDFGRYDFLSKYEFSCLINENFSNNESLKQRLKENLFIYDSSTLYFSEKVKHMYADSKNYLLKGTQLHIFVVTTKCNQQCVYCQAQNGRNIPEGMMTKEIAKRAVDIALQSPMNELYFEFQGGEPLLNFETIKYIVEYASEIKLNKKIYYSVVTNLTIINEEILDFIIDHEIAISTSLDGSRAVHDNNRPFRNGVGTFSYVDKAIRHLHDNNIFIGALETTTSYSLDKWKEIIDTYVEYNLESISIRPLTPLGCANENWEKVGYPAEDFIEFYKKAFDYIININKNGYRLVEGTAAIILKKALTGVSENYMELRSPCGAAIGQLAYYYDGNIYTCDEGRMIAEMGDNAFLLGNVFANNYDSLMNTGICKAVCSASILESLPSCSDCVYQPYCGTCPVVTYAQDNDIYEKSPQEYRCKINMGIQDTVFGYLKSNDNKIMNILWSWIN